VGGRSLLSISDVKARFDIKLFHLYCTDGEGKEVKKRGNRIKFKTVFCNAPEFFYYANKVSKID
jgi:hypothetical protein